MELEKTNVEQDTFSRVEIHRIFHITMAQIRLTSINTIYVKNEISRFEESLVEFSTTIRTLPTLMPGFKNP